jgi:hypothetical protein
MRSAATPSMQLFSRPSSFSSGARASSLRCSASITFRNFLASCCHSRSLLTSLCSSVIAHLKPVIENVFNGNAGHPRDALGLHPCRAELLACPYVHRLTRHMEFLRSVGQAVAGDLGEDVAHRVARFVDDHAQVALQRDGQASQQGVKRRLQFQVHCTHLCHIRRLTFASRGSYDIVAMAALQLIATCAVVCFGFAAIMRGASFMTLTLVVLLAVWVGFIMRSFYGY